MLKGNAFAGMGFETCDTKFKPRTQYILDLASISLLDTYLRKLVFKKFIAYAGIHYFKLFIT